MTERVEDAQTLFLRAWQQDKRRQCRALPMADLLTRLDVVSHRIWVAGLRLAEADTPGRVKAQRRRIARLEAELAAVREVLAERRAAGVDG